MRRLVVLAVSVAVVLVGVSAASSESTDGSGAWKPRRIGEFYAYAINERGQIVGEDGVEEAIVWQSGKARTLQMPESGDIMGVAAYAINDRGEIVGSDFDDHYALVWRNRKVQVLPGLTKGQRSSASDINNRGQIVGQSDNRPVVWEKGRPRALPGGRGRALGINDRGLIVGVVGERAVLWKKGTLRKLGTLGGSKSQALDVNERGQVLGWSRTKDEKAHGFLWQQGKMLDLGPGFAPKAINNRGQIVGSCRYEACLWESGKIIDLEFDPVVALTATGINERQQVVGYWYEDMEDTSSVLTVLWTYKP